MYIYVCRYIYIYILHNDVHVYLRCYIYILAFPLNSDNDVPRFKQEQIADEYHVDRFQGSNKSRSLKPLNLSLIG